jgi:hypothetical protein
VAGCKYNVTDPLWYQPFTAPAAPQITSIDPPSEAKPGVSTITIHGHNLVVTSADPRVPTGTVVKFGSLEAEVVTQDTASIVVRRPNLVTDSCTIVVIPHNAIVESAFGPYRIHPVIQRFGGFLKNLQLAGIAVDATENAYVIETGALLVHRTLSSLDNIVLGNGALKVALVPFCARIGPDGNLYVMENNRAIERVDVTAQTVARWTQLPAGKVVKFGDFAPTGYFYTGGSRTDLCIVPPNPPVSLPAAQMKLAGNYVTDEILAVRVYNGFVYVASRTAGTQDPAKIWKNQIVADSVASQSLVVDLANSAFRSDLVTDLAFSSAGTMFISTASATNPLLYFNPSTSTVDNYYKGIVPPYCVGLSWSKTSNYLYLISGNTAAAQEWTVYRLDMGTTGAP